MPASRTQTISPGCQGRCKDGRLFGSVRPGDVADAVQAQGVATRSTSARSRSPTDHQDSSVTTRPPCVCARTSLAVISLKVVSCQVVPH